MEVLRNGKFSFVFSQDALEKGIRASSKSIRNKGSFSTLSGMIGKDGALVSLDALTRIATSVITDPFPYPQLFVFTKYIIICGATKIYEYTTTGGLVEKLTVTTGAPWKAVDFYDYIVLSNESVVVTRNPLNATYATTTALEVFSSICNYNGQVLIGAPGIKYVASTPPVEVSYLFTVAGATASNIQRYDLETLSPTVVYTFEDAITSAVGSDIDGGDCITLSTGEILITKRLLIDGTVYCGIAKTTDQGDTWTLATITDTYGFSNQSIVELSTGVLFGITANPNYGDFAGDLYTSTDSGDTWTLAANLPDDFLNMKRIMIVTDEDDLVVGLLTNSYVTMGIWKSSDGGITWVKKDDSYYITSLFNAGDGVLLAGGQINSDGLKWGIAVSNDHGETWSFVVLNTTKQCTQFLKDSTGLLYALHQNWAAPYTNTLAYTSDDDGATWTPIGVIDIRPNLYRNSFFINDEIYTVYYQSCIG